jgi:RNA polymerase sigma-70 factor (ECF subfamily)
MAGDDAAYGELVRRRQSPIRNLMRRLSRDAALADDLAQQVFLQAWRSLRGLKSAAAFGAWLRKLAVNVWLQHQRANQPSDSRTEVLGDAEPLSSAAPALNERIDLDTALAAIPPDMRLCVVLAYSEGMSHSEISAATGLPLGTVKSHVLRGASRLRVLLYSYENDVGARHAR